MIAALFLGCATLLGGEPSAVWSVSPREAQIGQPVVWRLEIHAPSGSLVLLPDKDPPLDPSWVLLEPRRIERTESAGELHITLDWKACALEPGPRSLFTLEIPVETASGRTQLQPSAAELSVLPALRDGEDAPRPQKGFLPPPEPEASHSWIGWTMLAAMLGGALVLLLRRPPAPALPPSALLRLAQLEQEFAADAGRARETVFALTQLVRERTDARLQTPRAALPDAEWLRLVADDPRMSGSALEASRRLLERAEAVKYALATPSRFLVEELCANAREALAA